MFCSIEGRYYFYFDKERQKMGKTVVLASMYVCVCCRFGFLLCPLYVHTEHTVRESSHGIRVVLAHFSTITQNEHQTLGMARQPSHQPHLQLHSQ